MIRLSLAARQYQLFPNWLILVFVSLFLVSGCVEPPQSLSENSTQLSPSKEWVKQGVLKSQQGNYHTAIADFDQAIAENPDSIDAYYNRAFAYIQLGRWEVALADLTETLRLDPSWAIARVNRGNVYLELGQYDLAMADYEQALKSDPNNALAHHNLALVFWKLGKIQQALTEFEQALTIAPDYAQAYLNRGLLYAEESKTQQALVDLEQAGRLFQAQGDSEAYQDVQAQTQKLRQKN